MYATVQISDFQCTLLYKKSDFQCTLLYRTSQFLQGTRTTCMLYIYYPSMYTLSSYVNDIYWSNCCLHTLIKFLEQQHNAYQALGLQ